MYRIILKNLEVSLPIGIYDFEKVKSQKVIMHLECLAHTDYNFLNIENCIDYSIIANFIKSYETKPHVELIEQLHMEIVDYCFSLNENIYFIR